MLEDIFHQISEDQLGEIKKETILSLIKLLDTETQIPLLKQCLEQGTVLGNHFWTQQDTSVFSKPCSLEAGSLKKIREHLQKIDPTFVDPIIISNTNNSGRLFSSKPKLHRKNQISSENDQNITFEQDTVEYYSLDYDFFTLSLSTSQSSC
jgi:hypothetical protein